MSEQAESALSRFGEVGSNTAAPVCKCGALDLHPRDPERCARGHVVIGNTKTVVVGATSAAFWRAQAETRCEIAAAVIADAGYGLDGAPRALTLAADGIAQATLVRDAAFTRLVESAGPLTSAGRTRRAFAVWLAATDRLERHLRLIGLRRTPRPTPSLTEYLEGRTQGEASETVLEERP